jgi:peptide deformylase
MGPSFQSAPAPPDRGADTIARVSTYSIRLFGDPVLRQRAREVENVDGVLVRLAEDMIETMHAAPGVGLAATQVGVERRMFVYDIGDGPMTVVNPTISESRGEWDFEEGCLSVPGLHWTIARPKEVHLTGFDLEGNELSIDADEYLARVFQHELDHLDGVLLLERLQPEERKEAMRVLRSRVLGAAGPAEDVVPPPAAASSRRSRTVTREPSL